MKTVIKLLLFALVLSAAPKVASSHGEIVYCARYYLSPGSSGESHFHIYRIDPDGSHRVQLTFGNSDDTFPIWIGDGRIIQFYRSVNPSGDDYLMSIKADGTGLHRVKEVNGDAMYENENTLETALEDNPSPDGRYKCTTVIRDEVFRIVDTKTGKELGKVSAGGIVWLSNSTFATLNSNDNEKFVFTTYDLNCHQTSSIILTNITHHDSLQQAENDWAYPLNMYVFRPDVAVPGSYFVEACARKSSVVYWLDPRRKTIKFIANVGVEAWSPNYRWFCTTVFNGTTQYDSNRVVWTSLLATIDAKNPKVNIIQGGLIDCYGADWNGGHRVSPWYW